jgi:hypothetical protein
MITYKVSYVVIGSNHPGGIANSDHRPFIHEQIRIGDTPFEIIEVFDLMPARGGFYYIHATCRALPQEPVVNSSS